MTVAFAALALGTALLQQEHPATQRAESLSAAGRPWHAATAIATAAARESLPAPDFVVTGARLQLEARRWDRARGLLAGQLWLDTVPHGLALLGRAEARLGLYDNAAQRFQAARAGTAGESAALFAVREGLALEAADRYTEAAAAYRAARELGLSAIADWLRVREARVTADTAAAAALLAGVTGAPAREVPRARAQGLLVAGDSAGAQRAFTQLGLRREAVNIALARGDTAGARAVLYAPRERAGDREAAALIAELARRVPARSAREQAALASALLLSGAAAGARGAADRAVALGDSSAATLMLAGDARAAAGALWPAVGAYAAAAARDSAVAAPAAYRRARILLRLGDSGAPRALAAFADAFPADSAAPTALYLAGDRAGDRGDWAEAARWWRELQTRYPADPRASVGRFRLALRAYAAGARDSAAALFRAETEAAGPQSAGARYWLGRLAAEGGDSAAARATWTALASTDSLFGYYAWRARRAAGLPAPTFAAAGAIVVSAEVAAGLARLDTLDEAGLDGEELLEIRALLAAPPAGADDLLAWSDGLAERGFGPAAVRLGWLAVARAPGDARALRAVFPYARRSAIEAEAAEFKVDPLLFVAVVRHESTFDTEARSAAGARGLAQLMPGTAAQTARGLDVPFSPDWITVPDLNLHLGAAHFSRLLARYPGRPDAAVAAYNAGTVPVGRWLANTGAADPDVFLEQIGYAETRGYVRAVLRNRWLYEALYPS